MSVLWQGSKKILPAKSSMNIEATPMELDAKDSDANPSSSLATAEVCFQALYNTDNEIILYKLL